MKSFYYIGLTIILSVIAIILVLNVEYDYVDHKDLAQVRDYCERKGFSTDYYILVDFSPPRASNVSLSTI